MRAVAALVVALWMLPAAPPAQARRAPKPAAKTGRLEIAVSTDGAEVIIDGVAVARSPLEKPLTLAVGTHSLKVTKPGYAEFLDVVKIEPGRTTTVTVDLLPFAAAVTLDTKPSGAEIWVDGKLVGVTPAQLELDAGQRTIRLVLEGYKEQVRAEKLTAGESYHLVIPLEPLPRSVTVARRRPLYKKWWFWTAAGAVAVGTAAVVIAASSGGDPLADVDRVITPMW